MYVYSVQMETPIMHDLPEFKAADLTRHTSDLFDAAIPVADCDHQAPQAEIRADEHGPVPAARAGGHATGSYG